MKSNEEQMDLVNRYLSGQASSEEVERLEASMLNDPQLRADFLICARVDAALPGAISEKSKVIDLPSQSPTSQRWFHRSLVAAAAAIVLLAAFGLGLRWMGSNTPSEAAIAVAEFGELTGCRWVDSTMRVESGDVIASGQRIELSAGTAELIFHTGARLELVGPAIIEPRSDKRVFLTLGAVNLVAETPESKGFIVETPSSTFVDISTAFSAAVSPDGLSRLEVSEGEVDVLLDGIVAAKRLKQGETLFVEPGNTKIITLIEPGDGTPAFRFPTIPPPSSDDYADEAAGHASIRVASGALRTKETKSGPASVLLDGSGQLQQDAPLQSAFFDGTTSGSYLVDLGKAIHITKINSYSWHQHDLLKEHRERAQQVFTLYGFEGDRLPDLTPPLSRHGWTRIARVNSERFFNVTERLDRPAQQASSITSHRGSIGRYRYLLWVTKKNTFYGEFDVFASDGEVAGNK